MNTQKTAIEVRTFELVARDFLIKTPKGKETKLHEKVKLQLQRLRKVDEKISDGLMEIAIDCAMIDASGAIVKKINDKGDEQYAYDKEGEKKRRKEVAKYMDEQKFTIEVLLPDDYKKLSANLNEVEKEIFSGFVLPPLSKKD